MLAKPAASTNLDARAHATLVNKLRPSVLDVEVAFRHRGHAVSGDHDGGGDNLGAVAHDRHWLLVFEELTHAADEVSNKTYVLGGAPSFQAQLVVVVTLNVQEGDHQYQLVPRLLASDIPAAGDCVHYQSLRLRSDPTEPGTQTAGCPSLRRHPQL